ncbi:MAG: hypothetical protein K0S11_1462 [Gammaproteobacteria bacterium]|jgi:hypothetical protein|nr:hypothetical protein [Gammaproteobacteria bacterium]
MKSKFIVITLASIFAFGLSACDKNRHPASDSSDNPSNTQGAASLGYERTDETVMQRDDLTQDSHPGSTNTTNMSEQNSVVDNELQSTTNLPDDAALSLNPNTSNTTPPSTNSDAGSTNSGATSTSNANNNPAQNPNAITNPNPTGPNNS